MAGAEVTLGYQGAFGVEQGGGEISSFADSEGVGGASEGGAHLLGNGDEAVPDNAERDGIYLACHLLPIPLPQPKYCRNGQQLPCLRASG